MDTKAMASAEASRPASQPPLQLLAALAAVFVALVTFLIETLERNPALAQRLRALLAPVEDRLLDFDEAAELFDVSRKTIANAVRRGDLLAVGPRGRRRIRHSGLVAWASSSNRLTAAPAANDTRREYREAMNQAGDGAVARVRARSSAR